MNANMNWTKVANSLIDEADKRFKQSSKAKNLDVKLGILTEGSILLAIATSLQKGIET